MPANDSGIERLCQGGRWLSWR